jgi:hypothetical protein
MTDLQEFEANLRRTITSTARGITPPAGAVDRAIDAARAGAVASARPRGKAARWALPLAVAAAVAIIAAVVPLIVHTTRHNPPADPSVSPPPTVSTAPSLPTASPSTSASAPTSRPPRSHPVAPTKRVTLGSATLTIPRGWVARSEPSASTGKWPTWCLEPSTTPASSTTCLVMFREIPAAWTGQAVNPDIEGGWSSNPEYCGPGTSGQRNLLAYDDRTFGTRQADYRRWHYACNSGATYDIEQYVVATGPGYILFSEHADAQIHDVMTSIAKTAQLPAQAAPLRYGDTGIVRSVIHAADGYHVTIDRVVMSATPPINNNPATYPYVISNSVAAQFKLTPAIGKRIFVATDGHRVVQAYKF